MLFLLPGFVIGLGILCLFSFLKRAPVCEGRHAGRTRPSVQEVLDRADRIRYDVGKLKTLTPPLTGKLLRAAIWISYTPLGKMLMVKKSKKASNLDLLSGEYIPDQPTFYPAPPRPLADHSTSNQNTLQKFVDELLCVIDDSDQSRPRTCLDFYYAYKTKRCTPVGVAESILRAIDDSNNVKNPPLRAIVDHDPNVILAMAHASAERWKKGQPLSLMDGVPVAVKGEFNIAPYIFRGGAMFVPSAAYMQPECALVTKMREAGAIIIGVANMQESGMGTFGSNPNHLHGTARNPHNAWRYCGGSSSGSGASVAAGLCPIALGADGGGSVRIPAALCGVVGLKPTHRLLDTTGALPLGQSVGVPGPLCSSVIDVAIAMDIFTQSSAETGGQVWSLEGFGKTGLEGVTVGVYWEFFEHADQEVVSACKGAVEKMRELGADVIEVKIAELEECRVALMVNVLAEAFTSTQVDIDKHFDEINRETLLAMLGGAMFTAVDYINANKQRTRSVTFLTKLFEKVDLLVTPTVPCVAPLITPDSISDGKSDPPLSGKLMQFACLANLTGIPGMAMPAGLSEEGLPISLQLMAPWYQEGKLLTVAYALEKAGLVAKRPKDCFYDVLAEA